MKSINGNKLLHENGTNSVAYTLNYNGDGFKAPGTLDTNIVKTVASLSKKTVLNSAIQVQVTGDADALEGIYTDTVTFTIAAQ